MARSILYHQGMRCPCLVLSACVLFTFTSALNAQVAPAASSSSSSKSKPKGAHPTSSAQSPDPGAITDEVYRNLFFAFNYKIPFGWVERSKDMQDDEGADGRILLAIFERPPDAPGTTVNSAVVIAAEKTSNYPGLKTAADYFGPLDELTGANGFTLVDGPNEFPIGAKKLARGDFSKDTGKLSMQQSTLVLLQKGYVLSLTFIAANEDDVENLIGNLSFVPQK